LPGPVSVLLCLAFLAFEPESPVFLQNLAWRRSFGFVRGDMRSSPDPAFGGGPFFRFQPLPLPRLGRICIESKGIDGVLVSGDAQAA
jgi:hypothetical protein